MPGRDGKGPLSQAPASGRSAGRRGQRGQVGTGPAGYCVSPKCGEKSTHTTGVPCTSMKCSKCGTFMIRGS